jgi:ATP-dependent Clp protease ATP-binding subunit ClpA
MLSQPQEHAVTRRELETASIERVTRPGRQRGREQLQIGCVTDQTRALDEMLRRHIIGQDAAIDSLTCSFSRVLSDLRAADRPVLTLLLLGPTGVGKTETARVVAHAMFGSRHALTQINCEEYAHGHELSKLLGAPPGYVGHQLEPLLSQRRIDEPYMRAVGARTGTIGQAGILPSKEARPVSVILFDEIEKAHPVLWNAMLGILEDGRLTLGDNTTTDFTGAIILMTSNAGSREMALALDRRPLGFRLNEPAVVNVEHTARDAARGLFPLEFLNRFDEILVYRPLGREQLQQIFQKFVSDLHVRALEQAGVPLVIRISPEARDFIIDRGADLTLGARPLRRAVEAELVDPLSRLIAAHRIEADDVIEVERESNALGFYRIGAT